MSDELDLDSTTLAQRIVLLGVARRTIDDDSPHSADVRRTCTELIGELDGNVVGGLSEADAARRLNELEAGRLLDRTDVDGRSPVGKGRPRYVLGVDADALLDAFEDDDRVAPVVERIREESA